VIGKCLVDVDGEYVGSISSCSSSRCCCCC